MHHDSDSDSDDGVGGDIEGAGRIKCHGKLSRVGEGYADRG